MTFTVGSGMSEIADSGFSTAGNSGSSSIMGLLASEARKLSREAAIVSPTAESVTKYPCSCLISRQLKG